MSLKSAILYQNETRDVTLIDIPRSIQVAQCENTHVLLSTAPVEEPYVITNEPKSSTAKQKHSYYASTPLHDYYRAVTEAALGTIKENVSGEWCLPRALLFQTQVSPTGSMGMDVDDPEEELDQLLREWSRSKGEEEAFDFDKMMASLATDPNATSNGFVTPRWTMSYGPSPETELSERRDPVLPPEPWTSCFHNPNDYALDLTILDNHAQALSPVPHHRFRIPRRASVFLSDVCSRSFRRSFRAVTEEYSLPRHFDFVLLDPPWPSGSVKRKGNYGQVGGLPNMMRMLAGMDIDNYIEHNAIVGIWITNKELLREHILGPGGLFEQWNIGLFEEWIWIKTTVKGEPMFDIASEWRKPYETLLLGRAAPNSWTTMKAVPTAKRRVIAAVPDVHSRKPCLKELIEPFLPHDYSALEVFARNLTAGWTSWGDQVLKFNNQKYWVPVSETQSPS